MATKVTRVSRVSRVTGAPVVADPVVRRPVGSDTDLYDWRQEVVVGNIGDARSAVTADVHDRFDAVVVVRTLVSPRLVTTAPPA